jgi:anti-sigma B factor antagonist
LNGLWMAKAARVPEPRSIVAIGGGEHVSVRAERNHVYAAQGSMAAHRIPIWTGYARHVDLVLAREYITDGVAVISLTGEIDVYTAVRARESLTAAVESGHYFLVLDMRRTQFLDSTGLGVITGALKRCRAHDGTVTIVVGSLRILKIFRITGLYAVFRLFNDVTAAIEAVSSGDSNRTDRPGPHEYKPPKVSIDLQVCTPDFDESPPLRSSLFAILKEFAIEPRFLLPDDNGYDIREAVLALSAPVSSGAQVQTVCNDIERRVNTGLASDGIGDGTIRELVATLKTAHSATIRLGSALIAYADSEIVTRIFDGSELSNFLRDHNFREVKAIISGLKSIHAR